MRFWGEKKQVKEASAVSPAVSDVNAKDKNGFTALMYATNSTIRSDEARVQALIASGADVNAKSPHGRTPLMLAATADSLANVKTLIAAGADTNAKDMYGCLPLHYAKSPEIAAILLAAGARDCDCSEDCRKHKWSSILDRRRSR